MDRVFRHGKSDDRFPFPCKVKLSDREIVFGPWSYDDTGYVVPYWDPKIGYPIILAASTARVRYRQLSYETDGDIYRLWNGNTIGSV